MWSLKERGRDLEPMLFSNGKTQEDIVKEVISEIKKGTKIIFIKGVCGTGKSAIALNVAKELGRASIVVPSKSLQNQYEEDYTKNKEVIKKNGEKLKIKIIKGRKNFKCPFLEENKKLKEKVKREINATLSNFQRNYEDKEISCDNPFLPCKIEIKEKNLGKIREYLKENKKIKNPFSLTINNIKRLSIAPICKYWCPIIPKEMKIEILGDAKLESYEGLENNEYTIYKRKTGCGYYDQYQSYLNSDVIVFNSNKYLLEVAMNRKPKTEVEIIDECDEFLDTLSNQKTINLNRFNFSLGTLFAEEKIEKILEEIMINIKKILNDKKIDEYSREERIFKLKETPLYDILKCFLDNQIMDFVECDDENYLYYVEEVAKTFEKFFSETYVSFYKEDKNINVKFVTINLEKRFNELLEKNKVFVMMSGTIHSENVLRDIFGIRNFKIIEAETKMPGKITMLKTGKEINCKYDNFKKGKVSRENYLKALEKSIEMSVKPVLIHVNSFSDLPTEYEKEKYGIDIMSKEKLIELQKEKDLVSEFKKGKIKFLYTTKCNRGIDFPGKMCRSIVLTKYPFPNVKSLFWRILKKNNPEHYNEFYMDKAMREFLQKIYRGLRFKNDHIFLLSPDSRVFNFKF